MDGLLLLPMLIDRNLFTSRYKSFFNSSYFDSSQLLSTNNFMSRPIGNLAVAGTIKRPMAPRTCLQELAAIRNVIPQAGISAACALQNSIFHSALDRESEQLL